MFTNISTLNGHFLDTFSRVLPEWGGLVSRLIWPPVFDGAELLSIGVASVRRPKTVKKSRLVIGSRVIRGIPLVALVSCLLSFQRSNSPNLSRHFTF